MHTRTVAAVVLVVVLGPLVAGAHPAGVGQFHQRRGDVLVVGGGEYASIQAALDDAGDGDTVRVLPGTYEEVLSVQDDVTLVAPRGATLDGSSFEADLAAITIRNNASAVIDGFTIVDFSVGVDSHHRNTDAWMVRNTTIRNSFIAVNAGDDADWTLRNVTVENADTGVDAIYATGDWTVRDSVVNDAREGVVATGTGGDWTLDNVTLAELAGAAVVAVATTGDWRLVDATVRDVTVGVGVLRASGDWAVRNSTVANVSSATGIDYLQPALEEGVAVHAANTNGSWSVRRTRFVDVGGDAVVATGADPAGDATHNFWGPNASGCSGAVDCGDQLQAWPPDPTPTATQGVDDPSAMETTPDVAAGATTPTPTTTRSPAAAWVALVALVVIAVVLARR